MQNLETGKTGKVFALELEAPVSRCESTATMRGVVPNPEGGLTQQPQQHPVYRTEVDGLRATAIIPVICFHFQVGFPGGFTGVDVFYVISGFLITRILLSDISMTIFEFYVRRIRRLFPALVLLVVVVVPMGYFVLQAHMFRSLCEQIQFVLFGVANIYYYYRSIDYFFNNLEEPMLHCWSLAVEEQFYLFYPFLLLFLRRHQRSQRSVLVMFSSIFLISLAVSIAVTHTHSSGGNFAFYMLPSRAWQFVLGAMVARESDMQCFNHRVAAELCSWCGLGMIVVSYFALGRSVSYPGWAALLPSGGTALFIASQSACRTSCGQLLSLQLPVIVGRISYALYLWHWPIFVLLIFTTESLELSDPLKALGILITTCAAMFSYVVVEPFFRSPAKVYTKTLLLLASCTWIALLVFTMAFSRLDAVLSPAMWPDRRNNRLHPDSWNKSLCNEDKSLNNLLKPIPSGETCLEYPSDSELADMFTVDAASINADDIKRSKSWSQWRYEGVVVVGPKLKHGEYPKIAMIGSSHCQMWGASFERLALQYNKPVGTMCSNGQTGAFADPPTSWDTTRLSILKKWHPDVVLWFEFWTCCYDFNRNIKQLLERSRKVYFFGDVPTIPFHPLVPSDGLVKQSVLQRGKDNGGFAFLNNLLEADYGPMRWANEKQLRFLAKLPVWEGRVKFFPIDPYFIDNSTKHLMLIDPCLGTLVYKDFGHVNVDGSRRVEPLFRKEVFGHPVCGSAAVA